MATGVYDPADWLPFQKVGLFFLHVSIYRFTRVGQETEPSLLVRPPECAEDGTKDTAIAETLIDPGLDGGPRRKCGPLLFRSVRRFVNQGQPFEFVRDGRSMQVVAL